MRQPPHNAQRATLPGVAVEKVNQVCMIEGILVEKQRILVGYQIDL